MDDIDVKARITAEDDASPVIKALLANLRKLERITAKLNAKPAIATGLNSQAERALADHKRLVASQREAARSATSAVGRADKDADASLKKRMAFADRMRAQAAREERQRDLLTMKNLRQRINFADRMNRQRQREERAAASEARRQQATAHRDERVHRALMARNDRQSRQRRREATHAGSRTLEGASDAARTAGTAGLAVSAGAVVAARRAVTVELSNDDAMRNLQMYGGMDWEAVKRLRSEWAEGMAVDLGSTVANLLTSYTDALKAGIPNAGAKDFTTLASKAAEAWQMPVEGVTETLAKINATLTADGSKYDPRRLSSVVNTAQALAAQMASTPEGLMEFQRQASGAASLLGMSQESMLAFGSASIELGNKPGESGTMMDALSSRLINLPTLSRRKGIEGDDARKFIRSLGYGNGDQMDRARRADPDAFMFGMFEKLAKLKGKERDTALRTLFQTEWLGEGSRLVTGHAKLKNARRIAQDPNSQRAIDEVWAIHGRKLSFALKQMRASLSNVLGGFGEVLSPFVRDLANKLKTWLGASGKALKTNLWAGLQGMVEGLLGRPGTFRDLINSVLGDKLVANPKAFFDFFKGLGEGLRSVWDTVSGIMKGLGSVMGIDTASPEGMGKLAGVLFGGSIASKLLPGDLLGGAVKGVTGLVGSLVGGAAGAAAVGAAPVSLAAITAGLVMAVSVSDWSGLLGGIRDLVGGLTGNDLGAAAKGASNVYGSLWKPNPFALSRSWGESVTRWLFGDDALPKAETTPSSPPSPAARPALGNAKKANLGGDGSFAKAGIATWGVLRDRILGSTPAEPSTPVAPAASTVRQGTLIRGVDSVRASVDRLGGRLEYASLRNAGLYDHVRRGGSAANATTERNARYSDMVSSGRADELRALPAGSSGRVWVDQYDQMIGHRSATSGGSAMLDAIARAEGTAGRGDYNATLGYGRYGTPSKPLTEMNLNEAFAFGREIKSRHGSSSAIGRYQIVGNTMMDAARALRMDPATTRFDASTQDRMAEWIARRQGLGAWEGFRRNPRELATAQRAQRAGQATASPAAATVAAGSGSAARAVDSMTSMLGASETGPGRNTVNAFMRQNGINIDAAQTAWCAGFVNANLNAMGIQGTGRLNANSFLNWGERIDPRSAVRGDVLVEHRGRGAGQTGGHVGMATGNRRIGPNGQEQLEMISGNSGGRRAGGGAVQTTWEDSSSLAVRRAAGAVPTPAAVAANVPVPPAVAASAGASGRAGGGPVNVTNNITVNGANQSPEQIATAVERQVSSRLMHSVQDVELDAY